MGAVVTKRQGQDLETQVQLATSFPLFKPGQQQQREQQEQLIADTDTGLMRKIAAVKQTKAYQDSQPDEFHVVFSDKYCRALHTEGSADGRVMMINMDIIELPATKTKNA